MEYQVGDRLISNDDRWRVTILEIVHYKTGDQYIVETSGAYLMEYQIEVHWSLDYEYSFYKALSEL